MRLARAFLVRAAAGGLLWLVLTEGRAEASVVAAAAVALFAGSSLALVPPGAWRWTPAGLIRFVPFFLDQSFRSGLDVARRAFAPRLRLDPVWLEHRVRLPEGPARLFFVTVIGLLPGTLAVALEANRLTVHLLDRAMAPGVRLDRLEARVAALFGVALDRGA